MLRIRCIRPTTEGSVANRSDVVVLVLAVLAKKNALKLQQLKH